MSSQAMASPSSRRLGQGSPPTKRLSLSDINTKAKNLPSRVIVHGVPGIGKSSFPAFAPKPVYIMSRLETGIESLKDSDMVPEHVGVFPECQAWSQVLECVELLNREEHEFQTLVLDTINGLERMCHEHVCVRDYNDRFAAFTAYQAGYKVALNDWRQLLSALDRLREVKRMGVVLLAHTKVKPFKNPEGLDYDRYTPDLNDETWSVTHGWADMVLFANYDVQAKKEHGQSRAKGAGGMARFLYTTRMPAWDAKHRHGLPELISMGGSGKEAWANFVTALREGRKQSEGGEA